MDPEGHFGHPLRPELAAQHQRGRDAQCGGLARPDTGVQSAQRLVDAILLLEVQQVLDQSECGLQVPCVGGLPEQVASGAHPPQTELVLALDVQRLGPGIHAHRPQLPENQQLKATVMRSRSPS